MKKITYLLGLLSITVPKRSERNYKNSKGESFNPKTITQPIGLKTTYPDGINTWDGITPEQYHCWVTELNVSKSYTRFQIAPLENVIVNKKKLVLDNVL